MLKNLLAILILLATGQAAAQKTPLPIGRFDRDTIKMGELVQYSLVYRHPAFQEVILPDSSYSFSPFEFVRKEFYPTSTNNGISTDSAVYVLRTFAIAPEQSLAVPVYILDEGDTVRVPTAPEKIVLHQLVSQVNEPLAFRSETRLVQVEERFDWPRLLVWIVAIVVFMTLVWFIFGEAIKKRYRLYRLRKDHLYFNSRYSSHVDRFTKSGAAQSLEKAVSLWKNYLTKLERSAINSFTTKEIVEYYHDDENVNTALRLCDKAIYGNLLTEADSETGKALSMLRRFAKGRYKNQRELTRNAKTPR